MIVRSHLHGMILASFFAAMMMIGANITSLVPFLVIGGVPITLQTAVSVAAGLFLGKKYGSLSIVIYILIGLAGMPVFAQWSGGIGTIFSPTFGFILSYIATAYIVGRLTENNRTFKRLAAAALLGTAVNYIIGTNWMYMAYMLWFAAPDAFSYWMAWAWMMVPLPKDIVLAFLAAWFSLRVYHTMYAKKRTPSTKGGAA